MSDFFASPILSCAAAGQFEKRLFAGDEEAEWSAMERAGRAVGAAVLEDYQELGPFPAAALVLVLVGKGHNGGDALIAAREILRRQPGARVVVAFLFGERSLRPLAQRAWRALAHGGGDRVGAAAPDQWSASGTRYDVSLDGVFGFNFRPPLPAEVAASLRRANALPVRLRAAVDLPSGLDARDAFRADFTYATGSVKGPLLDCAAAGRVRLLDLNFFHAGRDVPSADRMLSSGILEPLSALRPSRSDKRSFGHLFIVGGSRQYPGAVLMNVLAALHSGVGLVTVFVPESLAPAFAARAPEAMWVGWPETAEGGLARVGLPLFWARRQRATAIALGSGLGRAPETLALVHEIVERSRIPVLLDADALQPDIVASARATLVLTPHAGEFERIAGRSNLRAFCARTGAIVALKGPVTRVCGGEVSGGRRPRIAAVYHSFFGGPVLARGGSGDLLAGLTAGQLAQMAAGKTYPNVPGMSAPLAAVCRGVVWHGLAADALARARGQTAVAVTELIDHLPEVLRGAVSVS